MGKALNLDFLGIYFGRYTLCGAIFKCFQTIQSLEQKIKKIVQGKLFEKCCLRFAKKEEEKQKKKNPLKRPQSLADSGDKTSSFVDF